MRTVSDPAPNPHLAYIIQISITPSVLNIIPSHWVIMKADDLKFIISYFLNIPKIVPGVHVG